MSLHPYLGYVYTPPTPDEERRIPVNVRGFLDEEDALRRRDPSRLVVGILGGSVSGQLGTWHAARLEDALRARPALAGRAIDLVKLGMPGYHQPQQVIQLAWILAQGGEFDVVVNLDGFNEIAVPAALNAPQGAHPLFPMNWSMVALDVPDARVRRHLGAVEYLSGRRAEAHDAFADSPWSWSPLAKLRWRWEDRRLADAIARHGWELQQIPLEEIPWFISGPPGDHDPGGGLIAACVAVWERASLQLRALCAAHGIRYLHLLQPNQYLPGSKPLSGPERESAYDPQSPYRPVVEEGYPRMRERGEALREAGVEFHDLSQLFADSRETLYLDSCCHFNADGNQLLADAMASIIAP